MTAGVTGFTALAMFQDVGPKADTASTSGAPATPATATTASTSATPAATPSGPMGILGNPMILMLVMMVPILLLSMRRNKKDQALRANLKKGDRVVSDSGLIGELIEHGVNTSKVKLAAGVTVEMMTARISPLVAATAGATAKDAKADKSDGLKDLKDAKLAAAGEGKK